MLAVALPEEMPVNETLDLGGRLSRRWAWSWDAIVVNALYPERFTIAEAERMEALGRRPAQRASGRR